jgi:hypothetical protein
MWIRYRVGLDSKTFAKPLKFYKIRSTLLLGLASLKAASYTTQHNTPQKTLTQIILHSGTESAIRVRVIRNHQHIRPHVVIKCTVIYSLGRAIAQEVSRRPLTAEAHFHTHFSPCEIYGKQSGTGQAFLRALRFYTVSIIPPWLCILIYHLGDKQ